MTGSTIVVGGGPAGVLLSYLLARGGVPVTLLESRGDFDRRFRGDTLAPPVLDYLDGSPIGSAGGAPQHEVEAQAGWTWKGWGARASFDWKSATTVSGAGGGALGPGSGRGQQRGGRRPGLGAARARDDGAG